jgi:hypothetical protein
VRALSGRRGASKNGERGRGAKEWDAMTRGQLPAPDESHCLRAAAALQKKVGCQMG